MSVDDNDQTAQQSELRQEGHEAAENGHEAGSVAPLNGHSGGGSGMRSRPQDGDLPDMSEMARLLDEQEAQFRSIKRGDVVEGQIVRIDQDEILVDIGLKSEGVLTTKELPPAGYGSLSELHVGDDVLVYVMQPETPEGHAVVSIKRARLERQWRIAQEQFERGELLEAEVIDFNKGGLIVNLEGIRGFVPISQIQHLRREDTADNAETQAKLQGMVGRRLQLKIIEINRNRNRLILSERLAVQEWRAKRREELLNELTVGEVRKGIVSNLSNFGAFVDLGGADGLVHISQLAWSRVNHPSEVLKVGQEVEVQVLSVDKEKKKIALSIKRAEVDPWTTVAQRYAVGQLVHGTITKIAPFGAFARIEDGIEGLIHLSEMPVGTTEPKAVLKEGQDITVRIVRIEPERRRLGLSVRQVEEPAPEVREAAASAGASEQPAAAEAGAGAPTAEGGASAPAAQPARPAARERAREEEPMTAMGAAFAAAALRGQQNASAAPAPAAPATPAASTAAATQPEATTSAEAEPQPQAAEPTAEPQAAQPAETASAAEPEAAAPAAEPEAEAEAPAAQPAAEEPQSAAPQAAETEQPESTASPAQEPAAADAFAQERAPAAEESANAVSAEPAATEEETAEA
ncbi:MAG TPA: S1 RNA-binding domain-containing protein [Ktedonobacterales bacterium]